MYDCLENENKILEIMQKGTMVYSLSKYGSYFYLYSTRIKGSCFIVMWLLSLLYFSSRPKCNYEN
jgi:NADH dehydrogenase FAD-containing subunit